MSSSITLHVIFGTGPLTEPGTHHCLNWLAGVCLPELGCRAPSPCLAFCKVSEDLLLVLTMCVRYLTLRVISPVPDLMFTVLVILKTVSLRKTNEFFSDCLK